MGLAHGRRLALWTLLVVLLTVPTASSAPAPRATYVTTIVKKTDTLAPGEFDKPTKVELAVPCPSGYKLLGPSVQADTPAGEGVVSIIDSAWASSTYHVLVGNYGIDPHRVTITISCGKLVTAKPRRSVPLPAVKVVSRTVPLPAATPTETSVTCPAGTFPIFGGYRSEGRVRADTSHPSERSWYWSLFWDQPPQDGVTQQVPTDVLVFCHPRKLPIPAFVILPPKPKGAKKAVAKKPTPARVHFSIVRQIQTLDTAGPRRVTATCKPGEVAVGGGYSLLSGAPDFYGTQIAKRSYTAIYSLESVPASPPEAVTMAVCVATALS